MSWRPEWEEAGPRRMGFGGGGGPFFAVAPITRTLVVLCILVTLFAAVARNWFGLQEDPSRWFALSADNAWYLYPFVTYVLPHSTYDAWHVVLNMVMLWFLGQELEARLGRTRFATLFFGAAVFGALAHLGFSLVSGMRPGDLMGASGGIFALLFFIARESPNRPFFFYFIAIPARVLAIILVIVEVWPLVFGGFADGVAHACHLAGAGFGWVWQRHPFDALGLLDRVREAMRSRSSAREVRRAEEDDAEMDRLLRKIHEQGMPSLTERERRFLDDRSKRLRGGPR